MQTNSRKANLRIEHVHPLNWWVGMHNPELQILLHGNDIGYCDVVLSGEVGVDLKEVVRPANKNYIIIYIDTDFASAQVFSILLKQGDDVVCTVPYELKERTRSADADCQNITKQSFDSSDVLYLLMPDRFACGSTDREMKRRYRGMKECFWDRNVDMARHGGDIEGIIQHFDYLRDLGVTAIWHTPTLENDMEEQSYHGYAITNYYETDPRLGTNEDYKLMVSEAHKRGLKVIKDIVFNHCGANNFLFRDRPADDWFNYDSKYTQSGYKTGSVGDNHAAQIDKELTVDGWFTEQMPDVNGKNRLFADYLIQASIWWIEFAGIDGYRQDTYPYNDFDMMKRWCGEIEAQYPGFNIVGETWINNNVGVSYWQKDSKLAAPLNSELRTVMDFPLMSLLDSVVDEETDEWFCGFARLYAYISQDIVYADVNNLLTFLANHDTDRFQPTKERAKNVTRYKQALTLLLTLRGIPQLYVGDEIGMYANKSVNDGALRQDFPGGWKGDKRNAFKENGRTQLQRKYFDFTKKMLHWRKDCEAVHYGKLTHYAIRNGCYVYSRTWKGKTVTVIMNGTGQKQTLDLRTYSEVLPKKCAFEVISGKMIELGQKLAVKSRGIYVMDFSLI